MGRLHLLLEQTSAAQTGRLAAVRQSLVPKLRILEAGRARHDQRVPVRDLDVVVQGNALKLIKI